MNGADAARIYGATIRDFRCWICDKVVGYRELYPPGVARPPERGPENPIRQVDRHWLYSSNGDRYGDIWLTAEEFARDAEALAGEQAASLMALYCSGCELVYCYDHWDVEYSDDWPRTVGVCSNGHVRVIED